MCYTIEEHKHRFAAWAAARAANRGVKGFKTECGVKALVEAGLSELIDKPCCLPQSEDVMDTRHKEWRCKVIKFLNEKKIIVSHGRAAKLINIYLKSIFVCGGYHECEGVKLLHPPIDRLLLNAIANDDNLRGEVRQSARVLRDKGWTKFESKDYQDAIKLLRPLAPKSFWTVERYWQGF